MLETEIEVRFIPQGKNGTRVELEHRHLDRYGARRDEMRNIFETEGDWVVSSRCSPARRRQRSVSDITRARTALITRILEGEGEATRAQRRAAFDNAWLASPLNMLIDTVAQHAYRVTDEDIDAAKASGLSEDQIFEIVVCAAIGQATRQYDAARAALAAVAERSAHAPRDPR